MGALHAIGMVAVFLICAIIAIGMVIPFFGWFSRQFRACNLVEKAGLIFLGVAAVYNLVLNY